MKKYIVDEFFVEIPRRKFNRIDEGVVFDFDAIEENDLSPVSRHVFDTKEEAEKFLDKQSNYYCYRSGPVGFYEATEFWLTDVDVPSDDDVSVDELYPEDGYLETCHHSNLKEFKEDR